MPKNRAKNDKESAKRAEVVQSSKNEPAIDNQRAKEIEAELSTIYLAGDPNDGKEPDMTRLQKAKHSAFKKFFVGLLVFVVGLTAISAVGIYYFGKKENGFTGEQVTLTIDGPDEFRSGEKITYIFKYRNASDTPIGTASLELRLPEGFVLLNSEPPPMSRNVWKIGSMPPWGRGQVIISGTQLSPLQKEHDFQAIVTYRPADFNSEFQKVSTKTARITDSLLEIKMSGAELALPGDRVEVNIEYRNGSEIALNKAVVTADLPAEFIPESAEPASLNDTFHEWRLDDLEPLGSGSIKIIGTFASEAYGHVTLPTTFGYLDKNESYVQQAETSLSTEVLQGQLVAALVLNGKSENQAVSLGEDLHYSISYRNTGEASLGNVEITVVIETTPDVGLIVWNSLTDGQDGMLDGNRISWTAKQIKSLERVEAGDEGMIDFTVPLALMPPQDGETSSWKINSWVETFVESIDGDVVNRSTKSQPIVASVLSDTQLEASARFYDDGGQAVGSGVIPPEVDRETTYRISWTLKNSLHELSDLRLKARLPNNVEWNGFSEVDAGDLRYNSTERELTWTLNWLPKTVDEINIVFDLTITPTAEQRDRIPTLIDATVFEATDISAEAPIILSEAPITTSLEGDTRAAGKGRVR
ncbi:MAG: hypothetical protein V1738_05520 [Patescibacteria group bacterium]